jgi:hypothetical protein
MATNPVKVNFKRTLTGSKLDKTSVARDVADYGGIAVRFDNGNTVKLLAGQDLPTTPVSEIDLTKVPGYSDLSVGNHTVMVAEISRNGAVGKSAIASFSVDVVPDAPTEITLS